MKTVIITGASGYIGRNLIHEVRGKMKIYAVVHKEDERSEKLRKEEGVTVVCCEMEHISRLPSLIPEKSIDYCIHLAWAGNAGNGRADYTMQLNNVKYTLDLLHVLPEFGVKRFVGAGTLAEQDVLHYHHRDGATPNAVSHYGTAKIAAHYMSKTECTKLGIEHIWCYLSSTYGIGNTTGNFVSMASEKIMSGEHAAFTSGEQMYDFVYITDTVKAIYAAAVYGKTNTSYYLGSGNPRPLKEFLVRIRDTIDPQIPIYLGEIPYNGVSLPASEYQADKLFNDTPYRPELSFEEGIKKTIAWMKEQNGCGKTPESRKNQ